MISLKLSHLPALRAKTGKYKRRRSRNKKMSQDRITYEFLGSVREQAICKFEAISTPEERRLVIYGNDPFPLLYDQYGKRLKEWDDLGNFMKCQIMILRYHDGPEELIAFTARIPPVLETKWLGKEDKIATLIRDRMRKWLKHYGLKGIPVFYSIEGYSKSRSLTGLHLHGLIALKSSNLRTNLHLALARFSGYKMKGHKYHGNDIRFSRYEHRKGLWGSYILKYQGKDDHRLGERRYYMSQSAISDTKALWNKMSGRG